MRSNEENDVPQIVLFLLPIVVFAAIATACGLYQVKIKSKNTHKHCVNLPQFSDYLLEFVAIAFGT